MIKLSLLIVLVSVLALGRSKSSDLTPPALAVNPKYAKQHTATHYMHVVTILTDFHCSAVAIAPHVLLTAAHCEAATTKITVDSEPMEIKHIERDEHDHSLLFVAGALFTNTVNISATPVAMGDEVYLFGNPFDYTDMFRKGYCMGHDFDSDGENIVFNLAIGPGDSGTAIFNDHGEVVDVVSARILKDGMPVTIAYPLAFTKSQLNLAKEF